MKEKNLGLHLVGMQMKYLILTILVYLAVFMFLFTLTMYISLSAEITPTSWLFLCIAYFAIAAFVTKRIMHESAIE